MRRLTFLALLATLSCRLPDRPARGAEPPEVPAPAAERPFGDPENRPHPPRERSFDVKHYKIEIRLDDRTPEISATTTVSLCALRNGVDRIDLDAEGMTFKAVSTLEEGVPRAVQFLLLPGTLAVPLGRALRRDESVTIVADYTAKPAQGLFRVAPDETRPDLPWMVWTQGETEYNHHWFPCWDSPDDLATTEVIATVRSAYQTVSNGALISQRDSGEWTTWHWKQEEPHAAYLVSLVAGDFDRIKESVELGSRFVPLDFYAPKGLHAAADIRRTFGRTADMIHFFSSRTGVEYPWAKYAQVCVLDFIWGGMENTSATTLHPYAVVPERAAMDRDSDGLIAHELAHQWFGDLVTCRTWSETWLNEGFATYFGQLWEEETGGPEALTVAMHGIAENVFTEMRERYSRPIVTDRYTDPMDMFDGHSYGKGAWVLHMLRSLVGDDAWWEGIRIYLNRNRGANVTSEDLEKAMEEAAGRPLDWFFDQWLRTAGAPEFAVTSEWDEEYRTLRLTLDQTQAAGERVFHTPLEVAVVTEEGRRMLRLWIDRKRQEVLVPLASRPSIVEIDPDVRVLKRIEWRKSVGDLSLQLRKGGLGGRLWAAGELAELRDEAAVESLAEAVMEDPSPAVRKAAVRALGGTDPAKLAALVMKLGIGDPKVRAAALEAMGPAAEREEVAAYLGNIGETDGSPACRSAAWSSLGRRGPAAYDALAGALGRYGGDEWIAPGVLEGLAATRDPRAVSHLLRATLPKAHPWIRKKGTWALGKVNRDLGPGRRDAVSMARLLELISDPSFHIRREAVAALKEVGDGAAAAALERRAAVEPDARAAKAMKAAARAIRAAGNP